MKCTKKKIGQLEKCYSLAMLEYKNSRHFLVAAEKHDACLLFGLDGTQQGTVWAGPGGVMTMEQVPGSDGIFLATHEFYSPNDSAAARIVVAAPGENGWQVHTLCELPFVHRFGILQRGGVQYLIACTLKSAHAFKDDWTCPGRIWVAQLPADLAAYNEENPLVLTPLASGLGHNHGFCKIAAEDGTAALVGTGQGVWRITPPVETGGEWESQLLLAEPTSDMLLLDLDGDGEKELVTMSPFHGDTLTVWHTGENGWRRAYVCPRPLPFLHAVWGGTLCGKETAVIGHRKGERDLVALTCENGVYTLQVLDHDAGPANVLHFAENGRDYLVAANRETDEIALYCCE